MEIKRQKIDKNEETNLNKYFQNIDVKSIPVNKKNYFLLENIYKEINQNPQQIILNEESQSNLIDLINKSNENQIISFFKNVRDPLFVIKKKIGALIYEETLKVFENSNLNPKKFVKLFCSEFIENIAVYGNIMLNYSSTYLLKKYYIFIKKCLEKYSNKSFIEIKEKIVNEKVFNDNLESLLKKINQDNEICPSHFTFLEGLCFFNQDFMQEKLKKFILLLKDDISLLKNKKSSFLYQKVVEMSKNDNISLFYDIIKNEFENLCEDKISNYVINELCKKYKNPEILYKRTEDLSDTCNIKISLLENALKQKEKKLCKEILKKLRKNEKNIFDLFVNPIDFSLNRKFLEIFSLSFENEDLFIENVKKEFESRFQVFWFHTEKGNLICKKYLEKYKESQIFKGIRKEKEFKDNKYSKELIEKIQELKKNIH